MEVQVLLKDGNRLRYIDVDSSMTNKVIHISIARNASRVGDKVTFVALNSNGDVIDSTISRATFDYTIIEGTSRLKIQTWDDGIHYCQVTEIEVVN